MESPMELNNPDNLKQRFNEGLNNIMEKKQKKDE